MAEREEVVCCECKKAQRVRGGETLRGWLTVIEGVPRVIDEIAEPMIVAYAPLRFCGTRCAMRWLERKDNVAIRHAQRTRREAGRVL